MLIAIFALVIVLLLGLWIGATRISFALRQDASLLRHRRDILLVTAHPDDEAFFFTPTIVAILKKQPLSRFGLLCLSNGNAQGLGSVRSKELELASACLGIRNVYCPNDERLQDGPGDWDIEVISDKIREVIDQEGFDTIVTFDERGISGHPNHRDVAKGAASFGLHRVKSNNGKPPIKVLALTTVPLIRKYISVLDVFFTTADEGQLISVDSLKHAWEAMSCHASQFVWFRMASVLLSRYTWLNNLREVPCNR